MTGEAPTDQLIGGGIAEARGLLDSGLKAIVRRAPIVGPSSLPIGATFSSADVDLAKLADHVAASGTWDLSFCLSGPLGSGNSAYARHLARRLGLDVLEKRYSDLTSRYVGESEKTIARAFEEAADARAFLLLDEADSLLRDPRAAQHAWEITQVNELLTQMERHRYPFACTTNALDLIDTAAALRFPFQIRFEPMSPARIAVAYRSALNLEGLMPADFDNVLGKASRES